jgi:cation-transporting P-type ATPase D
MEVSTLMQAIFLILITGLFYLFRKRKQKTNSPKYRVIQTQKQLETVMKYIIEKQITQIGIDTEYFKGDKYEGQLSIIQLSVKVKDNIHVYIVDLLYFDVSTIKQHLTPLLSDSKIEKILHSCNNDVEWIYDHYDIRTVNIFDTQEYIQYTTQKKNGIGLDELLNTHFNLNIDKKVKKGFQKSNWLERPLSDEQLDYAATDAYYLIDLKNRLVSQNNQKNLDEFMKKFNEKISRSYDIPKHERKKGKVVKFLYSNLVSIEGIILDKLTQLFTTMYELVDNFAKFKDINKDHILSTKMLYKLLIKTPYTTFEALEIIKSVQQCKFQDNCHEHMKLLHTIVDLIKEFGMDTNVDLSGQKEKSKRFDKGGKRQKNILAIQETCKKPIYENCKMLAPDNELLCHCDSKKMNWYLQKGIASLISENPPIFKLNFEPNRRGAKNEGGAKSEFYLMERKNCCVVCGSENNYMRFHIIPVLYRQYLPNSLKSHRSHDVVLLCIRCHERASKLYDLEKKNLGEKYNIPLHQMSDTQKDQKDFKKHMNYIRSLYNHFEEMPEDKRDELKEFIFNFLDDNNSNPNFEKYFEEVFKKGELNLPLDLNDITKDMLQKMKGFKMKIFVTGDKKNEHGKLVVNQITDISDFIKDWRRFFMDALKPQFLPYEWNIEHEIERDFGKFSTFNDIS